MRIQQRHDLVVEELGDEVLILDRSGGALHCLEAEAAKLWRRCATAVTLEALERATDQSRAGREALRELFAKGLLEPESGPESRERRHFLRQAVRLGVGVASTGVVTLYAERAEASGSCSPLGAMCGARCCSGLVCVLGICVSLGHSPARPPRRR